jgi:glycosyltransferase involved in cell wall biosynthesis
MSFVSVSKKVIGKKYSIDLLILSDDSLNDVDWQVGECVGLKNADEKKRIREINSWAENSRSDYLLFWNTPQNLPDLGVLISIIESGVDVAHCGLMQGLGATLQDLCMMGFSWDKLNAPSEITSTSWRLGLDACLIRRELFLSMGGLDHVFHSIAGAGLEFGYRSLKLGALIEHRPEMYQVGCLTGNPEPSSHDFYCFVIRHYGPRWAKYALWRRALRIINSFYEWRSFQSALKACQENPVEWTIERPWQSDMPLVEPTDLFNAQVSVIIPTLGRYDYLSGALKSMQQQSLHPVEVIVVDQNPPDSRQPDIYMGFEDINLKVIWQDERGQSLARNTGLASARGQYVFLFDDDSIAKPDLLIRHLEPILSGHYQVSTGVALPPPPTDYSLPEGFQYPRLAQTFDTGNALLSLDLANNMHGLDRNYDFGPGTDADFGTRLYLTGYRIFHNPKAVRIHFKAPVGGLRMYGTKKYNTDAGLLHPFPPVTQSYYALRYLNAFQRREIALMSFITSKFPADIRSRGTFLRKSKALFIFLLTIFLYPFKNYRSTVRAKQLLDKNQQLMNFENIS